MVDRQALDPIDAESLKLRDFKRDAHSPVLEVQETESYPHDKATRRKMLKQMERAADLETLELLAYRFNQVPLSACAVRRLGRREDIK